MQLINIVENIISTKSQTAKIIVKLILYNLPLIYGIERTRINYYLWDTISKIFKKNDENHFEEFAEQIKDFIIFLNYLKGLNHDEICDKYEFNDIIYLYYRTL